MAWLMFKQSGTYQHRGKKCDGFANQQKARINLSWGMDSLDTIGAETPKNILPPKVSKSGLYQKKSQQEELQKIMKNYQTKRQQQTKPILLMQNSEPEAGEYGRMNSDISETSQRMRYLQNSLITTVPIRKNDAMSGILNYELAPEIGMEESRVSRRSVSNNKKNQSRVVFGDGLYNEFNNKPARVKDFHEKLIQMYQYQDKKKGRNVSQIVI